MCTGNSLTELLRQQPHCGVSCVFIIAECSLPLASVSIVARALCGPTAAAVLLYQGSSCMQQGGEPSCLLVVLPDALAQALGQAALAHPLVHRLHARAVARNALALLVQVLRAGGTHKGCAVRQVSPIWVQ